MRKILFILLFMLAAAVCTAQSLPAIEVVLGSSRQTKQQTVGDIMSQTGYKIFFEGRSFNPQATVDFGQERQALADVLGKLTQEAGLAYDVEGGNIIIYHEGDRKIDDVRNLSGKVVDGDGLPLGGVTVEVMGIAGKSDTTSGDGRFYISGIPAGAHTVKITSADGQTTRFQEIGVEAGSDTEAVLRLVAEEPEEVAQEGIPVARTTNYFAHVEPKKHSDSPKQTFILTPVASPEGRQYMPHAAFKFNALYGAAATPNFAVEFGLGRKWTFDAAVAFNPFKLSSEGINRLWFVQPEVRYWPCQRFEKHFFGLHAIYGQYNIGQVNFLGPSFREHTYKGSAVGAGISWGYHRPLGKRLAVEFSVGAGYLHLDYDKFRCEVCDELVGHKAQHYFGPTKAAVSLIWMIK